MTTIDTTTDRTVRACPAWCTNATDSTPCRGEHYGPKSYLPATAGLPLEVSWDSGARFPVIGTGLVFSELDGDLAPSVGVHITGVRDLDVDLDLRPTEARALATQLLDQAHVLDGRGRTNCMRDCGCDA